MSERTLYVEVTYQMQIDSGLTKEQIEGLIYEALDIGLDHEADLVHCTVEAA
jgi:hypothetical protein